MDIDALPAVTTSAGSANDVASAICARRPSSPASGGGGGDNFDGDARWADLLNCCSCGEELCDGPLLLACLHVCCRKCFDAAANAAGNACGGSGGDRMMAGKRIALCAACQRDTATAAAPAAAASEGNADQPLDNFLVESLVRARRMRTGAAACGFCDDDDDDSSSRGGSGGSSGSGGSGKSRRSGAAAAHWCVDCARYLCSRCFLFHGRFNAAHLVFTPGSGGGGGSSPLPQPLLPVLCRQHGGAVCSLYCSRCERLLCRECSQRCLKDNHSVVRVDGEQAAAAARRLADELRDACGKLEEKMRLLAELSGGEGGTPAAAAAAAELDEARRRDLATQDENYRLALDMVDEAYREALAALDKLNGAVEGGAKAVGDRKEAAMEKKENAAAAEKKAEEDEEERLLRSLEHALEFSAALLDPAGGCGGIELLQLHEPVERRLRALCDRADRCLAAAAAEASASAVPTQQPKANATEATPERRVVIECHQPSNFGDVALNWIGVPRQQIPVGDDGVNHRTSELSPSNGGSASLAVQLRSASTSPASSANAAVAAVNAAAAADDRPRVLHFGSARRRIELPLARVFSMSVSADGHVLVAASVDGLIEYDAEAEGGGELGRWRPPSELGDDVRVVECLEDGRIAVAVSTSQAAADALPLSAVASTLVLLGKPDDDGAAAAWLEARRLALRCRALRLAACGETLAVLGIATSLPGDGASEAAADDGGGGRDLDLLCTYDGQSLLNRTLDCAACAVALTHRAVVLASAGRRDADFGGGGEYSLEAYSYDWAPLWRRDHAYPVRDICPQPLGYVLYISCGSDDDDGGGSSGCCAMKTVVAVSAEDGGYLCDLVHEPSAEGDAAAADGAILAYDGLRAQLALMPRVAGGCSGAASSVAVVELRPATVFK